MALFYLKLYLFQSFLCILVLDRSGTTILKLKAQESLTVILETLINRNLRLNRGKG